MRLSQSSRNPTAAGQNIVVIDHVRVRGDANYAWGPCGLIKDAECLGGAQWKSTRIMSCRVL